MEIKGSTIVITGASSGNGKALALALAKEGANLILAARREYLLKGVAQECATFLDTTGLDHAANFTGVKLAPPPTVYDPCDVSQSIVKLIKIQRNINISIA